MWFSREVHCDLHLRSLVKPSAIFIILLLQNGYCSKSKNQACKFEESFVGTTTQKAGWISTGINNEIVLSTPPCIHHNGTLITRTCKDGIWIPDITDTICPRVTGKKRKCPPKFEETSTSCLFIAPPQTWGHTCNSETLNMDPDNSSIPDDLFWLPFKRTTKFGPFVSVSFGEQFGTPFDKPINASLTDPNFFDKNCLVSRKSLKQYYPEYCNNSHPYVCEFSRERVNSKCPKDCISADYISDSCFCKYDWDCPEKANIDNIYDLTVIRDIIGDDLCYVGSNSVSDRSFDGLRAAISSKSWYYTDKILDCSICLSTRYKSSFGSFGPEPEMVLAFDETGPSLCLTVYHPESLFNEGSDSTIYCYTDADAHELKKKKKVSFLFANHNNQVPYNVYNVDLEKYIGNYWCEGFREMDDNDENTVNSNRVLAYKYKSGDEFATRLVIRSICILFACDDDYQINYSVILSKVFNDFKQETRVMEVYSFDFENLDILLHVTTNGAGDVMKNYKYVCEQIKEKEKRNELTINYIRSSDYCLPEKYYGLDWPLTQISLGAVPQQLCLQQNLLPVVRYCGGNFLTGAAWKIVEGRCAMDTDIPQSTQYLYEALNGSLTDETINNVTNLIRNDPNLPVISVYYAAKFLNKIYSSKANATTKNSLVSTVDLTDGLLNVNKDTLIVSQQMLNVTDDLIDLVESVLTHITIADDVLFLRRDNVIVHVTNPILSGVGGVVVYQPNGKLPYALNLPRNSTFEEVGPNALIALLIPEELLEYKNGSNITVISTIYFKDAFFESNYAKKPPGPVISVTIPEYGGYLPVPIPILFDVSNFTDTPDCGFWDYGKKTIRRKGHWSTVGGTYIGQLNMSTYHICQYSHLTHFSLLRESLGANMTETDYIILDTITIIGDVMSALGISGIFLTAIMFKKWRRKQGTTILLNLSVSIFLETILMQLTDLNIFSLPDACSVFGIFIHYLVICKFCWMLVYSFLQYMRFVKVLTILPENIVLKSVIFGWGLAVIPVAITNIFSATYTMRKHNYCYPEGIYLYLGILFPVFIIISINAYVFVAVMREVTSKTVESHGSKENVQKLQIQLGFLLFFVLGIPWIFWIFANLIDIQWVKLTLIYVFCISSNVQGFILFLFYVVFNSETRLAWQTYFTKSRPKSFSISTKTTSRS